MPGPGIPANPPKNPVAKPEIASAGFLGIVTLPSGTTTSTKAPSDTSAISKRAQLVGSATSAHSPNGMQASAIAVSGIADLSASRRMRPISVRPMRNRETIPTSTAAAGSIASCSTGTSTTDRPKPASPRTKPAAKAVSAATSTASIGKPKMAARPA